MNRRNRTRVLLTAAIVVLCTIFLASRKDSANADNVPPAEPFTPENVGATSNPDTTAGGGGGGKPSPTPTPPCPTYVVATVDMLGINPNGSVSNPIQLKTANAQSMSCLNKIVDQIMNDGLVQAYKGSGYWDDAVVGRFDEIFFPQSINYNIGVTGDPDQKQTLTQVSAAGAICYENMWLHPTGYRSCSKGRAVIKQTVDKKGRPKCVVVPESELIAACGANRLGIVDLQVTFLRSSPISLLWGDDADIEEQTSIVDFPLNPTVQHAWYSWKASSKTPLLVYNPSHDGKITSAAQLFGPWAFGGKKTASLDGSSVIGGAWKDGFEALASLDRNGDGLVSGHELDSLALWFDNNEDGISQPGEVLTLDIAGVKELYYNGTRKDAVTGNIIADHGYAREAEGKLVYGGSVDWFADTASTAQELNAKYILQHFPQTIPGAPEQKRALPPLHAASSDYGSSQVQDPLAGAWNWNYEAVGGPEGTSLSYFLIGTNQADQRLYGYAVFGTPFTNQATHGLEGIVDFSMFTGTFAPGDSGTRTLKWGIDAGDSHLKTEAVLSADGKHLSGTTTAYLAVQGSFKKVSYRWNASKPQ